MDDTTRLAEPKRIPSLDPPLTRRLRKVITRLRGYVLVEGVAWVVGFVWVALLIQFFLDYTTHGLQRSMRASLLALIVAGTGWIAVRCVLWPLRRRIGLADVARLVERRHPELSSLLISAVRFARGEAGSAAANSPVLMASVVEQAGQAVRSVDFQEVLNPRRARRSAMGLVVVLMFCVVATLGEPEIVGLWLSRNVLLHNDPWPRQTRLVVELREGVLVGARGDDLVVQAFAEGVQPREVDLFYETQAGEQGRRSMVTVGNRGAYRYRYTFKNAQRDFLFQLRGGDDRTKWYEAHLLDRPKVVETQMYLVPPPYARLEPVTRGDGQRSAQVLPGTRVTIGFRTNKPISRAVLMAGEEPVAEASADHDRYVVNVTLMKTTTYHFFLTDEVELTNRRPLRFAFRVLKDEPPSVRMKLVGVGDMVTPEAILPVELAFADTYGLAQTELTYTVSHDGTGESRIELPAFEPYALRFETSLSWPVAEAGAVPGESLTMVARAADFDTVSGPNQAQSTPLTLRVVTKEELLAELSRREQEYRMDFERIVDSQERLRSDLLTLMEGPADAPDVAALQVVLTPLERRQRNITSSVQVVRQQFEQILADLAVNQLDSAKERERLEGGIIEPLAMLAHRDLVEVGDTIRQWSRDGSSETARRLDEKQAAVLTRMREVLATMVHLEGYHEVVNMLRDIVRLQKKIAVETEGELEKQADDVFEDEE